MVSVRPGWLRKMLVSDALRAARGRVVAAKVGVGVANRLAEQVIEKAGQELVRANSELAELERTWETVQHDPDNFPGH